MSQSLILIEEAKRCLSNLESSDVMRLTSVAKNVSVVSKIHNFIFCIKFLVSNNIIFYRHLIIVSTQFKVTKKLMLLLKTSMKLYKFCQWVNSLLLPKAMGKFNHYLFFYFFYEIKNLLFFVAKF